VNKTEVKVKSMSCLGREERATEGDGCRSEQAGGSLGNDARYAGERERGGEHSAEMQTVFDGLFNQIGCT
jgi:hypothetical protein